MNQPSIAPRLEAGDTFRLDAKQSSVVILGSIAYGTHIGVAVCTLHTILLLRKERSRSLTLRQSAFVVAMFLFGTISASLIVEAGLLRNSGETASGILGPLIILGDVASIMVTLLSHLLLILRCHIIWEYNAKILIYPFVLLALIIAMGILHIHQFVTHPSGHYPYLFSYWALAILFNTSLTALIVYPVIRTRRNLRQAIGNGDDFVQVLSGVVSIMVESSLLYTISTVVGIPLSLPKFGYEYMFSPLLVQIECIASELIILRVVRGHAWAFKPHVSTVRFSSDMGHSAAELSPARNTFVMADLTRESTRNLSLENMEDPALRYGLQKQIGFWDMPSQYAKAQALYDERPYHDP